MASNGASSGSKKSSNDLDVITNVTSGNLDKDAIKAYYDGWSGTYKKVNYVLNEEDNGIMFYL